MPQSSIQGAAPASNANLSPTTAIEKILRIHTFAALSAPAKSLLGQTKLGGSFVPEANAGSREPGTGSQEPGAGPPSLLARVVGEKLRRGPPKRARERAAREGGGAILRGVLRKVVSRVRKHLSPERLKRDVRRWAVQDRGWVGRLASSLGTVRVEDCRFRIDSPLISDPLKSRLLYGRYERTERELLRRHLNPSLPVVELGGGMGVVSCLVNARLENPRHHVVVEANPRMLPLIRSNRELNGAQFELLHGAIAYGAERVSLKADDDLLSSQVADLGAEHVPTLTLQSVIERFGFDRCTLVCDIEGSEIELVAREIATLRSRVAMIVIEEHPEYCDAESRSAMFGELAAAGFATLDTLRKVRVLRNAQLSRQDLPAASSSGN